MAKRREVLEIRPSRETMEGAGVRLKRAFGDVDPRLDPFLLLDHFGSERPEDYVAGFPWHPHRGIETITYMLSGEAEHQDSLGNKGIIGPGEVQWMTAGSGIVHQEMPLRSERLEGFQLWSNLPRADKMMAPRYQEVVAAQIPTASLGEGAQAQVVCGEAGGVVGPVSEIVTEPLYLDVTLEAGAPLELPVAAGHNAFAYVFRGAVELGSHPERSVSANQLAILGDGDEVRGVAGADGARFLLVAGKPIGEPVAWGGPIVMNTEAELREAFREYREGTFLKESS